MHKASGSKMDGRVNESRLTGRGIDKLGVGSLIHWGTVRAGRPCSSSNFFLNLYWIRSFFYRLDLIRIETEMKQQYSSNGRTYCKSSCQVIPLTTDSTDWFKILQMVPIWHHHIHNAKLTLTASIVVRTLAYPMCCLPDRCSSTRCWASPTTRNAPHTLHTSISFGVIWLLAFCGNTIKSRRSKSFQTSA